MKWVFNSFRTLTEPAAVACRGSVTCRVGEDKGDGASSDLNGRIFSGLIHHEGEGVGLSWVAGRLQ